MAGRRALGWVLACAATAGEEREVALPDGSVERFEVTSDAAGGEVRHGDWELRGPDGALRASGAYSDGLRRGKWRWRDADGDLRVKGAYADGLRSGTWELAHAGREPLAEGRYEEGHKTGAWTYWRLDGSVDPVWTGTYEHVDRALADGGRAVGLLLDGAAHGEWTWYDADGAVRLRAAFVRGRRTGRWDWWHADGTHDPEFLSGDYGPEPAWAALEREPLPWGAWDAPPLEPARSRAPAPDPGAAPRPRGVPADAAVLRALDSALAGVWGGDEETARRSGEAILAHGPRVAAAYGVRELLALDLATDEELARARRTERLVVAPALGGRAYGIGTGGDDALALLRYASLLELTEDREDFWTFDLLPARPGDPGPGPLFAPPAPVLPPADGATGGRFGLRNAALYAGFGEHSRDVARAVADALAWLAAHQEPDGSWDGDGFMRHDPEGDATDGASAGAWDAGLTGLAALALLGDGHTTRSGPHADALRRALAWLLRHQDARTGQVGANAYEHAIATQVLARASTVVDSPAVRAAAQRAANHAQARRNPYSGWRYAFPPNGERDTSITGWMTLALDEARRAGLDVDPAAFEGALSLVKEMTDPATGRVGYDAMGTVSARMADVNDTYPAEAGEPLTALGLLVRIVAGDGDSAAAEKHGALLRARPPEWDPDRRRTDMYYWMHGTRAAAEVGGPFWAGWAKALLPAAIDSQRRDGAARGSWDPIGPWGAVAGRVYSTAAVTLALQAGARAPARD